MSQELRISLTFQQSLRTSIEDVNCWRGHCMELMARLDRAANAALAAWVEASKIPQTSRDRLDILAKLTAAQAAHADPTLHDAINVLSEIRANWRDIMAHATSTVQLDKDRKWVWHYSLPCSLGLPDKMGAISVEEAQACEKLLKTKVRTLCGRLNTLKVDGCT